MSKKKNTKKKNVVKKSKKTELLSLEKIIDDNLYLLNTLREEYEKFSKKRKILQEELSSNGYNSLQEKLEALKFKKND